MRRTHNSTYDTQYIYWGYSSSSLGCNSGEGVASVKRKAQAQTCSRPDSQTLAQVKVNEKERNKEKIKRGKESDSESGRNSNPQPGKLPAMHALSYQLSYRVTQQLSGIWLLKAELPGIQPKRIPSWHVRWGGCGKCEARGTGSDIRHAPDLTVRL